MHRFELEFIVFALLICSCVYGGPLLSYCYSRFCEDKLKHFNVLLNSVRGKNGRKQLVDN